MVSLDNKGQLTVVFCVSAAGFCMPPIRGGRKVLTFVNNCQSLIAYLPSLVPTLVVWR